MSFDAREAVSRRGVRYAVVTAVVAAVLVGSAAFLDRRIAFNDEMINVERAEAGSVFGYALRPAYYGANAVAWRLVGRSPVTLRGLGLAAYVASAGLICWTVGSATGPASGLFAAFLFIVSPLAWGLGIRGMPHLVAGAVVAASMAALAAALRAPPERRTGGLCAGALFAVLAVACHPTALAFGFAVAGLLVLALVHGLRRERRWAVAPASALATLVAGWVLLELVHLPWLGITYSQALSRGADRIAGKRPDAVPPQDALTDYAQLLWNDMPVLWIGLALALPAALAFALVRRRAGEAVRFGTAARTALVMAALAMVLVVSLALPAVRGPRVLLVAVPPVILAASLVVAVSLGALTRPLPLRVRRWAAALLAVAAVVVTVPALGPEIDAVRGERHTNLRWGPSWGPVFELFSLLPAERVGYFGPHGRPLSRARRFVKARGWRFVQLAPSSRVLESEEGWGLARRRLINRNILFFIVYADELAAEDLDRLRRRGAVRLTTWNVRWHLFRLDAPRPILAAWTFDDPEHPFADSGPAIAHGESAGPFDLVARSSGFALGIGPRSRVNLPVDHEILPAKGWWLSFDLRPAGAEASAPLMSVRKRFKLVLDAGRPVLVVVGEPEVRIVGEVVLEPRRWHRLGVWVEGRRVGLLHDGRLVARGEVAAPLGISRGQLRLSGMRGFRAQLDNLEIRPLPAAADAPPADS